MKMDEKNIVLLVLSTKILLIADVTQVTSELGDPDLLLKNPFILLDDSTLVPWLHEFTKETAFKIHSDKVLTITVPNPILLDKYQSLTK
jgi:hypothetical protein